MTNLEKFIEAAVATNCALADDQHDTSLKQAKAWLESEPGLASKSFVGAIVTGNAAVVEQYLLDDNEPANLEQEPRGWKPLLYLCFSRFFRDPEQPERKRALLATAKLLLDHGADPNGFFMLGDSKETCLYGACGVVNNSALTEMLLDYGAEVNDEEATYHVAEFDEHDCIRVLIGAGLDEKRQATILLRKIDFEDVEGVRTILDLGTCPNEMGIWGKSALHQAIMRGRSKEMIQLILERGGDPSQPRNDGVTPMQLATENQRDDVVKLLSEYLEA